MTREEILIYITENASKDIEAKSIHSQLQSVMIEIEITDKLCDYIVVTPTLYREMQTYIGEDLHEIGQMSIIRDTGIIAYYTYSKVITDSKLENPIGYTEADLPQKYLDRLPLI